MTTKQELLDIYNATTGNNYATWVEVGAVYVERLQRDILRNTRLMAAAEAAEAEIIT